MSTKSSSAYCWIRECKPDGSFHRVGCITMKKANKTHVKVAFSLCAPSDMKVLDLSASKRIAMRRLNEFKNTGKVVSIDDISNCVDWAEAVGISHRVMQHVKEGRVYAWDRNNAAISGLISEVVG